MTTRAGKMIGRRSTRTFSMFPLQAAALAIAITSTLVGCSSSSSDSSEQSAGGSTGTGGTMSSAGGSGGAAAGAGHAGASGSTSCSEVEESSAVGCDDIITAKCERLVQCCMHVFQPNTPCAYGGDVPSCKQQALSAIDCAKAGNLSVCKTLPNECSDALMNQACSDVIGGTAPNPASCVAFFSM